MIASLYLTHATRYRSDPRSRYKIDLDPECNNTAMRHSYHNFSSVVQNYRCGTVLLRIDGTIQQGKCCSLPPMPQCGRTEHKLYQSQVNGCSDCIDNPCVFVCTGPLEQTGGILPADLRHNMTVSLLTAYITQRGYNSSDTRDESHGQQLKVSQSCMHTKYHNRPTHLSVPTSASGFCRGMG